MKKILVLTALGILLPTALFAQSCSWVCEDGSEATAPDYTSQLRLSEFLPNPVGDDTAGEFIEIENLTAKIIDLTGWQISDASERVFTFKAGKISARGFFAISRTESKISLNNTQGETMTLLSPDKKVQDEIEFEGTAPEGASFARKADAWSWTIKPTRGTANSIIVPNEIPKLEAEIPEQIFMNQDSAFSATESTDPDGDGLSATWKFSDGQTLKGMSITRTFTKSGNYSVEVVVSDPKGGEASETFDFAVSPFDLSDAIVVNELYPKPDTGEDEFIEITNTSDQVVELGGWQMTDGSRTFTFESDATIEADGFFVLYKSESSIALNDTGDSIQLLRPDESVADQITYTTAQKAKSYARSSDTWSWEDPTPGAKNQTQETGVVLGAMTNASAPVSIQPIDVSRSFFQIYGAYLSVAVAFVITGFGLYKKWKKERADQDEYDVA